MRCISVGLCQPGKLQVVPFLFCEHCTDPLSFRELPSFLLLRTKLFNSYVACICAHNVLVGGGQAKDEVKKLIAKAQANELEAQPGRTIMESFENQARRPGASSPFPAPLRLALLWPCCVHYANFCFFPGAPRVSRGTPVCCQSCDEPLQNRILVGELQVNQVLNKARDDAGRYAQASLKDTNNVVRMVTAGSKVLPFPCFPVHWAAGASAIARDQIKNL